MSGEYQLPADVVECLSRHDYTALQKIGSGAFAYCYLVNSITYQRQFVAKRIIKFPDERNESEVRMLMNLLHPNIIKLYNYFWENDCLYIVLEYCPGGSLQAKIENEGPLSGATLISYCHQTILGLKHCHLHNIAHDDLKPANILLDSYGRIKLTDFGLSRFYQAGASCLEFSGSRAFASPQMLHSEPFNPFLSDIWALGVSFFILATGYCPWPLTTMQALTESVDRCEIPYTEEMSFQFRELLSHMIVVDPNKRFNCDQLLALPIFQQMSTSLVMTHSRSTSGLKTMIFTCHPSIPHIVSLKKMQKESQRQSTRRKSRCGYCPQTFVIDEE